eukprot:CAMPEP_0194192470 /NCGR_PEP_ID=MMETSP0154-20130528/70733_1 /TAXON_ID=1049557 /ORGANISM="Thalassiothrix antarctica, Strain L6-D1" /LENGTH=87 /DNA_ID=CAMNT_0038915919 /DNA_START=247 /DNA_END=510 /DNA_ORIENTATION=+
MADNDEDVFVLSQGSGDDNNDDVVFLSILLSTTAVLVIVGISDNNKQNHNIAIFRKGQRRCHCDIDKSFTPFIVFIALILVIRDIIV